MAPNATIHKAELSVSDMDRHYYATHALTLAQHPSETDLRLMVRLVAFTLFADERLEFGRGLSNDEEPDLWRRDYTGDVEQWIDLGHPDESRVRKACGRAAQVVVVNYGGHASDLWWEKTGPALSRLRNLTVVDLPPAGMEAVVAMLARGMRITAMIQDAELQLIAEGGGEALLVPRTRVAPEGSAR